ncbi:MAG: hypothetical protein QM655_15935 [Nocardioidaceae bacterium]
MDEYYELYDVGGGFTVVRVDRSEFASEFFDDDTHAWERNDAYYDEIFHNGYGEPITKARADELVQSVSLTTA